MAYENWPRMDHPSDCGCIRCRRRGALIERLADRSLSVALRHAQNRFEEPIGVEAVSPQGKVTLPGTFSGWSAFPQVTVNDLLSGSPPSVFLQKSVRGRGPGYLYRIYGQRPLYIGMAFDATIQDRVADHFEGLVTKAGLLPKTQRVKNLAKLNTRRSRSEIEKLKALVARMGLAGLKVHCGQVMPDSGYRMDPKFLHVFELALQVLGKPSSYVGSARTFEDVLWPG